MTVTVEENGGQCLADNIEASEPGNAQRLAKATKGLYKYVPKAKAWYVYEAGRWVEDAEGILVLGLAKKVPQRLYEMAAQAMAAIGPCPDGSTKKVDGRRANSPEVEEQRAKFEAEQTAQEKWMEKAAPFLAMKTWAEKSNNEAQLRHMTSLIKDLPDMSIDYETMDLDDDLINFTNGTFNVATGFMQPHDPLNLITKQCPVAYVADAPCPRWEAWLAEVQPDSHVRAFLQRIAGSCLIGDSPQNLFLNHGGGSNGKDTFYGRIYTVAGPYAVTATETMIVDNGANQSHDEDLARLKGARMLVFPETNSGDKLNTGRINNMTGGGRIRARHLYGKPFDFVPTYTAVIHTNHRPRINETTTGIWRRMIQIPWEVQIEESRRILGFGEMLEAAELEGIAAWIVRGAVAWRKEGLNTPESIRKASDDYRKEQDVIGRFLHDCWAGLAHGPTTQVIGTVRTSTFRESYVLWCKEEGIREWSARAVGEELTKRGYTAGLRKFGKDVARAWTEPDIEPDTISGDALTSMVTEVTEQRYTVDSEKKNVNGDVYSDSEVVVMVPAVTSVTEQVSDLQPDGWDPDKAERAYLTRSGFPVPPTDEELEAYYERQEAEHLAEQLARQIEAEEHYAHKHATEDPDEQYKPDWVE